MGFIVFQHNDHDEEIGAKSYLSLYSLPEFSLVQSHIFPTYEPGSCAANHCNGIYMFTGLYDELFIINLTTKMFKPLTLPELKPHPEFNACGIGQDRNGVYKIIVSYHFSEIGIDDRIMFQGSKNCAVLYSLDTGDWTSVQCPDFTAYESDGVYVDHERYWTAMTKGQPCEQDSFFKKREVVSFDFCSESFNIFPLPPYPSRDASVVQSYTYDLVEYGEVLGAIGYNRWSEGSVNYRIWVRKGQSWVNVHTFSFGRVERVLAALKDERKLCFAVPCVDDDERSEVLVVDMDGGRLSRTLNIYGQKCKLRSLPFVENLYTLQGGQPLNKSYSDDEDEEIEKKKKKRKKKSKKKSSKKH